MKAPDLFRPLSLCALLIAASCGDCGGTPVAPVNPGDLNGACLEGNTCNDELECAADERCREPGDLLTGCAEDGDCNEGFVCSDET